MKILRYVRPFVRGNFSHYDNNLEEAPQKLNMTIDVHN